MAQISPGYEDFHKSPGNLGHAMLRVATQPASLLKGLDGCLRLVHWKRGVQVMLLG